MPPALLRSMLYAPANRPDLVSKTLRYAPDAVSIDLEDGTPVAVKSEAREQAKQAAADLRIDFAGSIWLRMNSPSTPFAEADLLTFAEGDFDGLVVPKVETVNQVDAIEDRLRELGVANRGIMWGFETVVGVHRSHDILQRSSHGRAVYFGAEDYMADLGGRRTRDSAETLVARTQVAIAARLAGVVALDQVVLAIDEDEHFRTDARAGQNLGYTGKNCIHPSQIALCHEVYTPTVAEVDRATRLLACADEAAANGRGTANFEGQMIDTPLVTQARTILNLAEVARR